ncbi:MAG: DUF5063 domain-containing protein [Bacteroidota bacterium]
MQEEIANLHNYVYSSEMVEFVTAANGYCSFLEHLKGQEGKAFISEAVTWFSGVYASFVKLGVTEPSGEAPGDPTVSEQEWSQIYQRISMILGAHNDYLRLADEGEFDRSELVSHTISEDAADVYQELRDFTTIYSRGMEELMNDAAWELGERFAEHWGKKLLQSLGALHDLFVAGIDPTEKE